MLASTALISLTPKPVAVLLCFGRWGGSVTPGAGGVAAIGADIIDSVSVVCRVGGVASIPLRLFEIQGPILALF